MSSRKSTREDRNVTKQEFVDAVADKAGMTKRDAGTAVDAALDVIERTLVAGDSITFTGFGKFHVTRRAARQGVNPRTGEPVQISAANVPKFSAGSQLKKAVNASGSRAGVRRRRGSRPPLESPSSVGPPLVDRTRVRLRSSCVQLSFDAADRLVELVEARRGPVDGDGGGAEPLRARERPDRPRPLAPRRRRRGRRAPRLARRLGRARGPSRARTSSSSTRTSSSSTSRRRASRRGARGSARSARSGSARSSSRTPSRRSSTRASPLPAAVTALTGHPAGRAPRGAAGSELAMRRFLEFAGDAALVAHNARFDLAFLDREVELLTGRRIAAPVVDTVWLAKRLLGERTGRFGLAALAHFFGVSTAPCHRALPDAQATAEILVRLLGLAQERGATDARRPRRARRAPRPPAPRQALARRGRAARGRASTSSAAATSLPLYVGRARDLRARLRVVLRRRPAATGRRGGARRARARRVVGDGLGARGGARRAPPAARAAAACERARHASRPSRLPPAARRAVDGDRGADAASARSRAGALARRAAQALAGHTRRRPPRRSSRCGAACGGSGATSASRTLRASATGSRRSSSVVGGPAGARAAPRAPRVRRRARAETGLRPGARARRRAGSPRSACCRAGRASCRRRPRCSRPPSRRRRSAGPEDVDELRLVASFLRKPPPELRVAALERDAICALVDGIPLAA